MEDALPVLQTKAQLSRYIKRGLAGHLYDESGVAGDGVAIYSLSDPRDIRELRYLGQATSPRRRLLQHLNAARLWLPDERPWWIKDPKFRPLYQWIREIYQDERRLPVMVVWEWVEIKEARHAERARIFDALQRQLHLLNFEAEKLKAQIVLI